MVKKSAEQAGEEAIGHPSASMPASTATKAKILRAFAHSKLSIEAERFRLNYRTTLPLRTASELRHKPEVLQADFDAIQYYVNFRY
jgi:hypothetical protein